MLSEHTVYSLRKLWPEIVPTLLEDYERVKNALVDADSMDSVRLLQGQAKAARKYLNLPEALAMKLEAAPREAD